MLTEAICKKQEGHSTLKQQACFSFISRSAAVILDVLKTF
jgi:hypothetical protein